MYQVCRNDYYHGSLFRYLSVPFHPLVLQHIHEYFLSHVFVIFAPSIGIAKENKSVARERERERKREIPRAMIDNSSISHAIARGRGVASIPPRLPTFRGGGINPNNSFDPCHREFGPTMRFSSSCPEIYIRWLRTNPAIIYYVVLNNEEKSPSVPFSSIISASQGGGSCGVPVDTELMEASVSFFPSARHYARNSAIHQS
ncbi:hypothetical protein GGS21DRAFT_218274 [Xylaria nigripes]|nr:hypothetical protein GGS21DRAFT_218274 [Xylaria nigripes]